MQKGERTRQRIVEAAASVFNRHGYSGSGMSELMRETGLAKGGIYRHFESKESLAAQAFNYASTTNHDFRFADLDSVTNAIDKLQKFIRGFMSTAAPIPGGCPILNTAVEHDDGNPALLKCAGDAFDTTHRRLTRIIKAGQARGEVKPDIGSADLALFIFCALEGAIFASRLQGASRNRLQIVGHQLIQMLENEVRQTKDASI